MLRKSKIKKVIGEKALELNNFDISSSTITVIDCGNECVLPLESTTAKYFYDFFFIQDSDKLKAQFT